MMKVVFSIQSLNFKKDDISHPVFCLVGVGLDEEEDECLVGVGSVDKEDDCLVGLGLDEEEDDSPV